jgi:transcription initiation factor IIE alpha subunit
MNVEQLIFQRQDALKKLSDAQDTRSAKLFAWSQHKTPETLEEFKQADATYERSGEALREVERRLADARREMVT